MKRLSSLSNTATGIELNNIDIIDLEICNFPYQLTI